MDQNIKYRSNDAIFYNSQCLFIEYHDVLAMPWFTLLAFSKNSNLMKSKFNIDELADYDISGLFEWYVYRKHRNIFKSIGINNPDYIITDEDYDTLLQNAMKISDDIYRIPTNLKFLSILRVLLESPSLVKQIVIYSEHNEPMIEQTLQPYLSRAGSKIKYLHGAFEDVIKLIPRDSTYVLSDIEKVNAINKEDKLKLSCILIPNGLRYNYLENDPTKLKVDLNELSDNIIFKYSFFDNFDLSDAFGDELLESEINTINTKNN